MTKEYQPMQHYRLDMRDGSVRTFQSDGINLAADAIACAKGAKWVRAELVVPSTESVVNDDDNDEDDSPTPRLAQHRRRR